MSFFSVGKISRDFLIQQKFHDLNIIYVEDLDSTNTFAKNLNTSADKHLIITDFQSNGRGRSDHSWKSQKGTSLLSSWCFHLNFLPSPVTSIRVGLALYKALCTAWPELHFSMKAPNDLYLNEGKLAGILIENIQQIQSHFLIIGIGLNVFAKPNLSTTEDKNHWYATCLHDHTQIQLTVWESFIATFYDELESAIINKTTLTQEEQCSVLHALNQNPNLKEKYLNLDSNGSLYLNSSIIHWKDL